MSDKGGYYAYLKTSNGEIRLSGDYIDSDTIEMKGANAVAYVGPNGKGWKGAVTVGGHTYDLVGKVKTAASGVQYVFLWNPKDKNFFPKMSVFEAGYKRETAKT